MGKNEKTGLGRALVKHHNQMIRQSKERGRFYNSLHTKVLESITEVSNKDAVIEQAEEADRLFSFQHPAPNLPISLDTSLRTSDMTPDQLREQQKKEEVLHASSLRVPRSLEENEKLVLTPFEKNLDIWRQLWRVVERSDLLVMVVDARDPFFYCCPDLEGAFPMNSELSADKEAQLVGIYAHEVDEHKRTLLLINKADLLPFSVRQKWAEYFRHQGILFIFWSAKAASVAIEGKKLKELWKEQATHETNDDPDIKIYGRDELLSQLQSQAEDIVKMRGKFGSGTIGPSNAQSQGVNFAGNLAPMNVVVGFVGYPNVGKSSTINALVGQKWAGVTSTPGKTKHFQTLKISEELTLCDCPGLVFPSFTSSRYEMIASGVLPIDRMTEHREAVQIVSNHVSRHIIEDVYKIKLPKPKAYVSQSRPPLASELLRAYCASRGYVASSGLPDETRAARQILKDYIDGKLPHYEMPPGMFSEEPSVEDDGGPRLSEMCESDSSDTENHPDIEGENAPILEHVLDDISLFDETNGLVSKKITVKKPNASHKHHKKSPRKKDRSWRIRNDDGDGMPLSLPKVCECRYYPA